MIITINGDMGSGKSSVARILAKKLNLKHYSMGDLQGKIAVEKGLDINELSKLEEEDDKIDRMIEERQTRLGEEEDDFVIDSRLGWHCMPDSIKVFLTVNEDEGARRVMQDKRADEKYGSIEEAKESIARRKESEIRRYMRYYGVNHFNLANYDLIIDTTKINQDKVAGKIMKFVKVFGQK